MFDDDIMHSLLQGINNEQAQLKANYFKNEQNLSTSMGQNNHI